MNPFAKCVLLLAGLGFLGYGIAFELAPQQTMASGGLQMVGPGAAVELRAFYGGLETGLGLWLCIAAFRPGLVRSALWLTALTNGGSALSRALALLLGGEWNPFFAYALPWELGFASLALIALWITRTR
ncbi:MAG: DUF4345 family protein [Lysobacteraceae bacterium]